MDSNQCIRAAATIESVECVHPFPDRAFSHFSGSAKRQTPRRSSSPKAGGDWTETADSRPTTKYTHSAAKFERVAPLNPTESENQKTAGPPAQRPCGSTTDGRRRPRCPQTDSPPSTLQRSGPSEVAPTPSPQRGLCNISSSSNRGPD